jgi:hypothetical protein
LQYLAVLLQQSCAHKAKAKLFHNWIDKMGNAGGNARFGNETRLIKRSFILLRGHGGKHVSSVLHSPNKKERVPEGPTLKIRPSDDDRYEKEVIAIYTRPGTSCKKKLNAHFLWLRRGLY